MKHGNEMQLHAIELENGGSVQPPNEDGRIHILDAGLDVVQVVDVTDPEWKDYMDAFIAEEVEQEAVKH